MLLFLSNIGGILLYIGFIALMLFILHAIITSAVRNGINTSILNKENQQTTTFKDKKKSFFDTDLDD